MNIGERALISHTTQLSRDALTRAMDGTAVHPPSRGQLLRILGPPIIFVLYGTEGAEKIVNRKALVL